MELICIDIKSEKQTVAEAIAQFLIAIDSCKIGGFKVMKVIHGYGSHGVGGDIKRQFIKECQNLKNKGKIYDYICCDNLASKNTTKKMAINYCPDLLADKDIYYINPGCSIVVL